MNGSRLVSDVALLALRVVANRNYAAARARELHRQLEVRAFPDGLWHSRCIRAGQHWRRWGS